MAITKKSWTAVAVAVCMAVAIAPPLVGAQQPNNACGVFMLPVLTNCFFNVTASPTAECCDTVKAATTTQVRCLCDSLVNHNEYGNLTQPFLTSVFNQCGLPDKLSCLGSGTGAADKVSSMGLFASLFLIIFY